LPRNPSPIHLRAATDALQSGGVIACPTEAVWGLSCDPLNEDAVFELLELKRRPMEKGLILVAGCMSQITFLLSGLSEKQRERLSQTWPGPVTWLLPHNNAVPRWVTGEHDTVAVRVSAHPVIQGLCAAWGGPLVSTSANRAGKQPARTNFMVRKYFGRSLDYLLPGALGSNTRPTQIKDLSTGQTLRT